MLGKISIDGFRHFKNFTLELETQAMVLSGLNGTGKTTVVELLNKLQLFLMDHIPVGSLCAFTDIPAWDVKEYGTYTTSFGFTISDGKDGEDRFAYQIEIQHNFRDKICRVQKESLLHGSTTLFAGVEGSAEVRTDDSRQLSYPVDWSVTGLALAARNNSKIRKFLTLVRDSVFAVSLNPHAIASMHQNAEPTLKLDGSNFSAWYDFLLGEKVAVIAQTFVEIRAFIPGFIQFIFVQDGKNKELFADITLSPMQKYRLPFESLSDGQKILCVLHILIKTAPGNSTIIIDECENFLAPTELQPLYNAAQDAFEENNAQFLFVSHHPRTMNWFQDNAIIFSLSGSPPFVTVEKFVPDESATLDECLLQKAGS